jgi:DNA invertase Pin-like site-specific DNA recombinase
VADIALFAVAVLTMTIYGYARVSTNGQDLDSQEDELLASGCAQVFKEKISGAKTDRAELAKVLRRLEPGDVLLVTKAAALPEVSQQCRDEFAIQLLAVTRARSPSTRVA